MTYGSAEAEVKKCKHVEGLGLGLTVRFLFGYFFLLKEQKILFSWKQNIERKIASNARTELVGGGKNCLSKQHFMDQKNVRWN